MKSVFKSLQQLFPSCAESVQMQSRRLDGPLPIPARIGLRLHLVLCKWCRRYERQMIFLRQVFRQADQHPSEAYFHQLPRETADRIKARLREEIR